jgi:hypothetical protein
LFDDIIGACFLANEVIAFAKRGDKYRIKLFNFTTNGAFELKL